MSAQKPSSAISIIIGLALFCGFIALVGYNAHASEENTKRVDQIFADCPRAKPVCVVSKTQNAKFAVITRIDFEVHACKDGRSAYRESNRRTLQSTYELYFVDMTSRLQNFAQQQGCTVR